MDIMTSQLIVWASLVCLELVIGASLRSDNSLQEFHIEDNGEIYRTKRQSTESDSSDHLFHGEHLWGLEDYHEGGEGETRKKRQAAEGDSSDHLFHGEHLWGLEDYHEGGEGDTRKKRQAAES